MIVVTGASGKLGHHVVEQLLQKVPASQVAVAVRNPDNAQALAALGVQVRQADYAEPSSLGRALEGADKLLLISSNALGQRVAHHTAVIGAAKHVGVGLLAYTSILRADSSPISLAREHLATELALRASGLPFVLLRNGWYTENHTEQLGSALQQGAFVGSAKQGRIASAARADYAAAAVSVLTGEGHVHKTYELAGDSSFTMAELAAEVSRQTGKTLPYNDLPRDQYKGILLSVGLPEVLAEMLTDADESIAKGALEDSSGVLSRLIGRPTTTLAASVAAALRTVR
jgi:NAD(P)H dehydrogenase (quinone)